MEKAGTDTIKICSKCKIPKSLTEDFYRRRRSQDGRQSECKDCRNAAVATWKAANPERVKATEQARVRDYSANIAKIKIYRTTDAGKAAMRRHRLKADHDITPEEYEAMWIAQNGECAICLEKFKNTADIDHDHKTGKRRSLLCRLCNIGIGLFRDDPILLEAASKYLREFMQKPISPDLCSRARRNGTGSTGRASAAPTTQPATGHAVT